MERFRTVLKSPPAAWKISHTDRLMLIGSCFTEHLGNQLKILKINSLVNPFGIVYNPVSMARRLLRLWQKDAYFTVEELFENAGLWHSPEHHGHFSKPTAVEALAGINADYRAAAHFLKNTTRLLITLGTANVYVEKKSGMIVANNHKLPANAFEKRRLSVTETVDALAEVLQTLKKGLPDLQIVLTVSPVRHLADGLVENQRSKATLTLACEELCRRLPFAEYFPAYELLLDDLRDYRFYAADMIHPSETAVAYIWERFSEAYFDAATQELNARIGKIAAAVRHRPFHPTAPEHRSFALAQLEAIDHLEAEYPFLDFAEEKSFFKNYLPA
jgi:GSCFA family